MIDVRPQKPLVTASVSATYSANDQRRVVGQTQQGVTAPAISHQTLSQNELSLVYRQFEQQAAQCPQKIAIRFEEQQLSYGALNRQANQLARHLISLGAGPDVLIGVCLERSVDLIVAILAIHKAGSAYLPLDLGYPSDRIQYILSNAQAHLLIGQGSQDFPATQATVLDLNQLKKQLLTYSDSNISTAPNSRDLAYVIYTSGSTGQPKGVQIEHRSLSNLMRSMAQQPGLTATDVTLTLTTVAFDMSLPELFLPLSVGATMELVGRAVATDGHRLRQLLETAGITWMQGTPSTWRMLLAAGWQGNAQLKILIGGEATPRTLANQLLPLCQELWNMYGPTETTVWSMAAQILADNRPILLGQPLAKTQVYLMEELPNGELYPTAPGQPGEICIGGWGVARGYLNRPKLNREKFIGDFNSREIGAKLYRTGDLAQAGLDGSLEFIGRIDHQVKIRGHRVELGAVEAALAQHPHIAQAAVIAHQDQSQSQQLIGYIVPQGESDHQARPQDLDANATQAQSIAQEAQAVVKHWKTLWDDAYRLGENPSDPTFDFSGYRDTYTGDLLPAHAIEEWTERTVERILALQPRRVLEVGCGKGLLLFRAAPQCDRYVGLDVSPAAIAHLQNHLDQNPQRWSHVSLACAAADELTQLGELSDAHFDTIVINSVIQYFPDQDYLLKVFEQLVALLQPGGKIFLGDVRNLDLLSHFHSTVLQQRQLTGMGDLPHTVGEFKALLNQQCKQDHELLLKPDFFAHLQAHCPRIRRIVTQLKRGHERNELIDFRYDVVLHLDDEDGDRISPPWMDWKQQSLEEIEAYLTRQQPESWGLRGILNGRLSQTHQRLAQLEANQTEQPIAALFIGENNDPPTAIDPESLWQLGQQLSYRTHISWGSNPGTFDVTFQKITYAREQQNWAHSSLAQTWPHPSDLNQCVHQPWQAATNSSEASKSSPSAAPQLCNSELRQFLAEHLPAYMVPSQFVLLEQLPLTPNNKVNRQALPMRSADNLLGDRTSHIAPTSPVERQLAQLWENILNLSPLGKTAHFFDCGGHSLLATQLMTQIRETFNLELSLAVLFQAPVLEDLATAIAEAQAVQAEPRSTTADHPAKAGKPETAQSRLEQQIQADCQLDPTITPGEGLAPLSPVLSQVLLTGATGFVGGFLLQELLEKTEATVHCLVRSPNRAEAQRKLENHLEQCQVPWEQYRDRIIAIPGDLAQPNLGLTPEQYQTFQSQLDAIYHNGAYVNLIYPYNELRAANIHSTVELLRLASQVKLKAMHYVSTLDVLHGEDLPAHQQLSENQALPPNKTLSSDYARTKWVAEHLVMAARQRGIPCNIYRLGMTTGHSRHGYSNPNDMIGRLLRGMVAIAAAPTAPETFRLNLAPVDSVCQTIVALSLQLIQTTAPASTAEQPIGQTFHTSHPQSITLADLIQSLENQGYPIQLTSYQQWHQHIMNAPQSNALQPLLGDFGSATATQGQDFFKVLDLQQVTTENVQAALPSFHWPNLAQGVLEKYIRYLKSAGLLTCSHSVPLEASALSLEVLRQ